MFSDVVGYSAMMQRDEADALKRVRRYRELLAERVKAHHGEVLKHYGDGSLSVFNSAVEAVSCAQELQLALQQDPQVPLRIGIHIGDVVHEEEDLYGDGVNIAARIQTLAPPGAVLFTHRVMEDIRSHPELPVADLGFFSFKNIAQQLQLFALCSPGLPSVKRQELQSAKGMAVSAPMASATRRMGMGALVLGIVALLLSVVFLWHQFRRQPFLPPFPPPSVSLSEEPSVAVLPFKDLSPNGDQAWFSEGIAEEILLALSRIQGLKVAGRSSSFAFGQEEIDPREIGRRLNVGAVLEGSIRRSGNRVRITAQLVNTADGFQIWSESHDQEFSDIFSVQEDIAYAVASKLTGTLLAGQHGALVPRSTLNPAAYQAYLQGRYKLSQRSDGAEDAVAFFQQAVRLDSTYAAAHAGLGHAYIWLGYSNSVPSHEAFPQARSHARKALSIDPRSAYAWSILGTVQLWYDWDWPAAKVALDSAIALNSAEARAWLDLGWYHALRRDFQTATDYMRKAVAMDSADLEYNIDLADIYRMWGKLDKAERIVADMQKLYPQNSDTWWMAGLCAHTRKDYATAVKHFEKTVDYSDNDPWAVLHLIMALGRNGQQAQARKRLETLLQQKPLAENAPVELAMAWLGLGERQKALDLLEQAYRLHANWLISISIDPVWDDLRQEARFKQLVQLMNFPQ